MLSRRELANAIRALSIDAVEKAKSGHPGAPLGMADMAEALWRGILKHNPADPAWSDRDRFILSNGHASMLLYSVLHLTGYDLDIADIKNFRRLHSKTPGHPEYQYTPGVEMTTGPLGQGLAAAVGMAVAETALAAEFNRPGLEIVDHFTYVFAGDGCLMEGISHEACSLAGTLKLGKLIVLYDSNGISIDGQVKGWFGEDVAARFRAYGWQVIDGPVGTDDPGEGCSGIDGAEIPLSANEPECRAKSAVGGCPGIDGHDGEAVAAAIRLAREDRQRPTLIICKTHIGFGSPNKADSAAAHGAPLGPEEAAATRERLGWNHEPFVIPEAYRKAWDCREQGAAAQKAWEALFSEYERAWPDLAAEFRRRVDGGTPAALEAKGVSLLRDFSAAAENLATRQAGLKVLNALSASLPELFGGSADLTGSVGTKFSGAEAYTPENRKGRYLYYGVREFGMGAIMNGIALHGGFIPYGGTFLIFSDYALNAIRLAALMRLRVVWVLTHDSIGVGEDGPTHQPVEQVPGFRLTPGLKVWRPCDAVETAAAWLDALGAQNSSGSPNPRHRQDGGPSVLALSRQNLPCQPRSEAMLANVSRGAYILKESRGAVPEAIIIASGSEVALAMRAASELDDIDARVVSMPCAEVFEAQSGEYRDFVLPPAVRARVAVEAAEAGWWARYVGLDGMVIGMRGFGESAPAGDLFDYFGFTPEAVKAAVRKLVKK